VHELLTRKYYIDDLYEGVVTTRLFYNGIARFLDWVDREVIDRAVDFIGWLSRQAGPALAPIQNGQVQAYGLVGSIGTLVIVAVYLLIGG
jgi:NADH:ubiquinone oxidoreductase subunit 5 (subunit L)/multisubunit Na+/H+ antiporter MnhA subunit